MIFREKDLADIPEPLLSQDCQDEIIDSVNHTEDRYSGDFYGHELVRTALNSIYKGKCCYCERIPESTLQIEHFRPKGRITGINNVGYYWMGNEWSNLLLACDTCNNKKRSQFPLVQNNHIIDHPIGDNGDIDFDQLTSYSEHLIQEEPLLINPEVIDPELHLVIDGLGYYTPKDESDFGKKTIKKIGLNRDSYVVRRQSVIDEIMQDIIDLTCERYHPVEPLTINQYKRQLGNVFRKIVGRTHDNAEYNLLSKSIIANFDEIILEEIEEEFREEIYDLFVEFLENL